MTEQEEREAVGEHACTQDETPPASSLLPTISERQRRRFLCGAAGWATAAGLPLLSACGGGGDAAPPTPAPGPSPDADLQPPTLAASTLFQPAFIDALQALDTSHLPPAAPELLIAAQGDELLDWHEMVARYPGAQQRVLQGGDHALSSFPEHLTDVLAFCDLVR